ncbi:MAG TPA: guanylate kinase [Thermoanaerobaculia bacterium]|jgi:guanylate kinase|nr:guanylate kinase [Thermoanaerobaculia bacterium]
MSSRGELFILSGPSGCGKTSLIRRLLDGRELDRLAFSVSHTTRAPRSGEIDGGDYHFVTRDAFDQMVESGRFLEWARVHDHQYGTSLDEVMPRLASGIDVLLDIDVQGARQVLDDRRSGLSPSDVHGVFVLPPTYQELRKRLLARNLDREEVIGRRLTVALQEIESFGNYEYVIINHDINAASRVLASIILEKRHRTGRMRDQVAVVLEGFEPKQSHT